MAYDVFGEILNLTQSTRSAVSWIFENRCPEFGGALLEYVELRSGIFFSRLTTTARRNGEMLSYRRETALQCAL